MPIPPGSKLGSDYSRIKQSLARTASQQINNPLFQTVQQLVDAAIAFQSHIDEKFPQLDGSNSSLFNTATDIINELQNRNNSIYAISLTNSQAVQVPPNVETILEFDLPIFDDGLIQLSPSELRINADAIWQVQGRVVFCVPTNAEIKVSVGVQDGGVGKLPNTATRELTPLACSNGTGKFILPFVDLVDLLRNDIVTLSVFQTGKLNIDVLASLQLFRVTYVDKILGVRPRRVTEPFDDQVCKDNGKGTDDCECEIEGVQFAVLPQSNKTYFLTKDAKLATETPTGSSLNHNFIQSTFCPNRRGNFYLLLDDNSISTSSRIEEVTTSGKFVKKFDFTNFRLGQGGSGGYHSFLELPCDFILTVKRTTHQLVEIDISGNPDIDDAKISRFLGLTIDPFDGTVNQSGNRLLYANGTALSIWDLTGDVSLGNVADLGYTFSWPTWLTDCSVIVFKSTFLTNGDFARIDLAGNTLQTYTYNQSIFPNGLIGYAANLALDRLWIVGLDSLFRVTTTILKLTDGSLVAENVNWMFAPNIINNNAMVNAIYQPIRCSIQAP